jgi:hypothetical protein
MPTAPELVNLILSVIVDPALTDNVRSESPEVRALVRIAVIFAPTEVDVSELERPSIIDTAEFVPALVLWILNSEGSEA